MSLPMLVNGADCGPINPLQGLAKTFDHDRGLQQDHFGAGKASSSRETFRSEHLAAPGFGQDAAQFFSGAQAAPQPLAGPSSFDFAALRSSLPAASHAPARILSPSQPQANKPLVSWAADFLVQTPKQSGGSAIHVASPSPESPQEQKQNMYQAIPQAYQPQMSMFPMNQMAAFSPQMQVPHTPQPMQLDQNLLEKAFQSHEVPLTPAVPVEQQQTPIRPHDADELARTAGLLVDSINHEQNPKFKNSQFLGLMRGLRDRTVMLDGNEMVASDGSVSSADVKGKGRALDHVNSQPQSSANLSHLSGTDEQVFTQREMELKKTQRRQLRELLASTSDSNEAYFRQDNEQYIKYWGAHHSKPTIAARQPNPEWDQLQQDWDAFEATTTGVRPVTAYSFQSGNPYLLGERSADNTRTHMLHGGQQRPSSFYESVLQLEATVQREPTNARAWFELGVKQQENEREQQAIHALQRALELDPAHLPSWLALAISYTNEGDRQGTYNAVEEWVARNEHYRAAVETYKTGTNMASPDHFDTVIGCLIAMARSDGSGEVNADTQIALAVLLNTNEDYARAQDCFRAALSVRPDDWLLYNRVGATLANSGQPEEAISYYYRALEINPAYIRARYNLGISCINLRRYDEAAQHILDALVLQDSDSVRGSDTSRGVTSYALWDSLRTTCLHMQRVDLAAMCDRQDLEGIRAHLA